MFKELLEDPFYEEYKKYPDCEIDYCILEPLEELEGIKTHKEAVLFAMNQWNKIIRESGEFNLYAKPNEMKGTSLDEKDFFEEDLNDNKEPRPYYYLFLKPPHSAHYNSDDFRMINKVLFPKGTNHLELVEWSTDWSNYFDDGLEWWGARCVSIYDKELNRFVIIAASATD